jgi:uncharacterized protein YndB with AHSA1/START domain
MMQFSNTVTIDRPVDEVFAFLTHFENLPRWNYAISETRKTSLGPVGVGARYEQTRAIPTQHVETFEVTAFEPYQTVAIRGTFSGFPGRFTYELESMGKLTRLVNTVDLETSSLVSIVAPLMTSRIGAAVAENLDELKHVLESPLSGGRQIDAVAERPT